MADPILAQLVHLGGRARGRYAQLRLEGHTVEASLAQVQRERMLGLLPERRASGEMRRPPWPPEGA